MKSSLKLFVFAVSAPMLFIASSVFAQSPASFFDIFTETEARDEICDICNAIQADITEKELIITSINNDLSVADRDLQLLDTEIDLYDRGMEEAQKALETLRNPKDYAESEGRRYNSADHSAMQRRSTNLWNAYKSGDMTAQEYSDEIAKDFDAPDVAKELEKIKKTIEKEILDSITEMEKSKKEAEKDRLDINAQAAELTLKLEESLTELEELLEVHARCELLCKAGQVNVVDLGIKQEERSAVSSFFDIFTGLFTGPSRILPEPTLQPELLQFPIEIIELDLKPVEPIMLPDNFFDIFTGLSDPVALPVPEPTCQVCDPIEKEIANKESELLRKKGIVEMAGDLVKPYLEMEKNGKTMLEEAEKNLDRLKNPTDYVASEGRRYDGADHSAMQVRSQRLWAAYRAGILSAADLEVEWAKDLDDPDVQRELEDIKEELTEELEDVIDDIEEQLEDLEEKMKEFNEELAKLQKEIADCESKLAVMRITLEECQKQCTEIDDVLGFVDDLLKEDLELWELPTNEGDLEDDEDIDDLVTGDFALPYMCCSDVVPGEKCEPCEEEVNDANVEVSSGGFLCDWLGWFCKEKEEESKYEYDDLTRCVRQSDDKNCLKFDVDNNSVFDERDLNTFELALHGPNDLIIPIDPSGLDGNDGLSFDDYDRLGSCFIDIPACDGLGVSLPSSDFIGLSGNDFLLQGGPGGNPIIGGPVPDDFINIGGGGSDILSGGLGDLPTGLFGPGGDDILGDPPGLDLIGPGGNDPVGPLPSSSEPNMQNDSQVQQVVQAAVQRYLQSNPLGPCEKLEVQVRRLRVGNTVRYTVTIKRVRDNSLCPPIEQCPAETHYESIGVPSTEDCTATCQNNGEGCAVIDTLSDGRTCILCAPLAEGGACGDGRREGNEECEDDTQCQYGMTCSQDCTCVEGDDWAKCGNGVLEQGEECESDSACQFGDKCNLETCTCTPVEPESSTECPDLAYKTNSDCLAECSFGECQYKNYKDVNCFFCVPKDFAPSSSSSRSSQKSAEERCDAPTMDKGTCESSCDGECDKSYTTISGLTCYECEERGPVCGDGNVDPGEECDDGNTSNGDGCDAECQVEPEDTESYCPDGTTDNYATCDSQCSAQGGTCVDEGQTGCYGCIVVNCPGGSYKDECPSSCADGCDVVGSQHGVSCYQCKQSCEDTCAQQGYGPENTDHSSAILSELNGYSCVSGANVSIQTATMGSCSCVGEYSLSVDQTPPVCTGTPCGDVTCGSSESCQDGDTTITVNCNWGGWEKIDKHQFRPVVGN